MASLKQKREHLKKKFKEHHARRQYDVGYVHTKRYAWVVFDRERDSYQSAVSQLQTSPLLKGDELYHHLASAERAFRPKQVWVFDLEDIKNLVCNQIHVGANAQLIHPVSAVAFATTLSFALFMKHYVVVESEPMGETLMHEIIEDRWPPTGAPPTLDIQTVAPGQNLIFEMTGLCRAIVVVGIAEPPQT